MFVCTRKKTATDGMEEILGLKDQEDFLQKNLSKKLLLQYLRIVEVLITWSRET